MRKNKYDKFMIENVLPAMCKALNKEDKHLRRQLSKADKKFYSDDIKGVASYNLTERTLQYIIYRELCSNYKILPEDLAYGNKERIDLSIYKDTKDREKYAEIGIELKQVKLNKDYNFSSLSIEKIIEDFTKIKNVGNKNKYLLLTTLWYSNELNKNKIEDDIIEQIDNRLFRGYSLKFLSSECFKTDIYKNKKYYHLILLKLVKN